MSRGTRVVAIWIVVAVTIAGIVVLRDDTSTPVPPATELLRVDAPRRLDAGTPMRVTISGANPALSSAQVVVTATAGSHLTTLPLQDGRGDIELAASLTRSAGVIEVWAIAGADEAVAEVRVDPGSAVEPIVPFVGPKSIVADGEDHAMVVAIISDRFGNPVPDRVDAVLGARQPGDREAGGLVETTGLVTWRRAFSGTIAGRAAITVSLGGVDGPVADLDEVAGRPAAISVTIDRRDGMPLRADGRRLHRLVTERIVDRFANVVTDGTAVAFQIDEPGGRRALTAPTVDGRAEVWVEAPAVPGPLRVVASSSGVTSEPLTVDYVAAVDEIPARVSRVDDRWTVDVGPVAIVDGGWIPDGTEIAVLVPGRALLRASAIDGRAAIDSADPLPPGTSIRVLGVERALG